jgi:hypothetical protein
VATVDGQKYAVGLMWQPVQNLDDPIPEIRETIESEADADLYCFRQTSVAQYGVGRSALGHKSGMPSLAASVAGALSRYESFCGVFKVKEGWWFVAVRNNLILAEEDVLFATEEEAQGAFSSMMAVPDWDLRIVPEDWNIEGTTQRSLDELVHKGRKIRLQEINAARRTYFLIFLAAIIVLAIFALVYFLVNAWRNMAPKQTIQPVQTPTVIQPVAPEPEKPNPWEELVDVTSLIKLCWDNAYQVKSISFPGWNLGLITCDKEGLKTTWTRNGNEGFLSWIRFGIKEYQFTDLAVNASVGDSTATGTIAFSGLPIVASFPTLTPQQLLEDLTEIQQYTNMGLQFSQQTLVEPPNRPDGSRPPNQKVFNYFSFSATSDYTPWEWMQFFEKFSGLELIKIEYNPSNDTTMKWKYEGRIYAK